MADITIDVTGFGGIEGGSSDISITGFARTSDMDNLEESFSWAALVAVGTLATTINTAIKDAAIAAAAVLGHTVGALDKKNVLGGATGL